jgi:cell division protein FtsN
MPHICRLILPCLTVLLLTGCGSTEQIETSPPPAPRADSAAKETQPPVIQIETKTDTLVTLGMANVGSDSIASADSTARFTIQVGAFKEPKNAAAMQALVKLHCQEPVMNEFNARSGLYQIRVGKFVTQAEAAGLLRRLLVEHSSIYTGSWVVRIGK